MMLYEKYKNYFQKQKKPQLCSVFKMIKDWSWAKFPLSHLCWLQHIHVGGEQVDFKGFVRNLKIDMQQEVVFCFFQKFITSFGWEMVNQLMVDWRSFMWRDKVDFWQWRHAVSLPTRIHPPPIRRQAQFCPLSHVSIKHNLMVWCRGRKDEAADRSGRMLSFSAKWLA